MQKIEATGDGKSAVATPDGKKPKEEEVFFAQPLSLIVCFILMFLSFQMVFSLANAIIV